MTNESKRLKAHYNKEENWLKWGPYLSERQWGTVREDYSADGSAWSYFPHDHARSRVYRWGEDGLAGISDDLQRLCFSVALWNGKDPILKERLFGLTGPEGNHGEDCKELYYYLDNTPTHSYMKHLYKYPQSEYPYQDLVESNKNRSKFETEYELTDTHAFVDNAYFDVFTEYAKADAEDILIKISVHNRGANAAEITVLPQIWFRNLWSFGLMESKPIMSLKSASMPHGHVHVQHEELGEYNFYFESPKAHLFTENETNTNRIFGVENESPYVKDLFHTAVVGGTVENYQQQTQGTKFAPIYTHQVPAHSHIEINLRLSKEAQDKPFGPAFTTTFAKATSEAGIFYQDIAPKGITAEDALIQRQAFAGMLWTKQYYNIDIPLWINGDVNQPAPPESRKKGRNMHWHTLNNEDIISMPDKWEYPWYAAWDLAFHCIPLAMLDATFAKEQLLLFLREWYMHPNGQIPAYEWAFGDVNPPVHAMSCLRVYAIDKEKTGKGDVDFLKKAFHKLCLNFTWWVNRKDSNGKNVFEGGFLGLDNIGLFDRSSMIPGGGHLEQADGTSWMGMYCLNMLEIALEITRQDHTYEGMATKFFEHFALISESLNRIGNDWTGAWSAEEGFFYDILALPNHEYIPLKVRSLVGLSTLFGTYSIGEEMLDVAPEFSVRLNWYNNYLQGQKEYTVVEQVKSDKVLLSLIPKDRLVRLLEAMLSENEFLSPYGIRSISKIHEGGYYIEIENEFYGLDYEPAESSTGLFGGNSNWRGPIWMPMNYMLIQSLLRYHDFFGDSLQIDYPTGSGEYKTLEQIALMISNRLINIFRKDENGQRPVNALDAKLYQDPHFSDLILFYEYFDGNNGRGVGASHQTGWTGVIAELIQRQYA